MIQIIVITYAAVWLFNIDQPHLCFVSGISCPYPLGMFKVERPYATFRVPAILFPKTDPFPPLENANMEPKDILLLSSPKTGETKEHLFCTENKIRVKCG